MTFITYHVTVTSHNKLPSFSLSSPPRELNRNNLISQPPTSGGALELCVSEGEPILGRWLEISSYLATRLETGVVCDKTGADSCREI